MTANMQNLIEDAKKADYTIETIGNYLRITRQVEGRKKIEGLVIYSNGTAFDLSVRPDVAKVLRTYKSMRKVLGI